MAGDLKVLSPQDWLAARKELLAKEKEALRVSDELAAQRQNLGVVEVTKDYTFTSPIATNLTLADLFEGRKQLILYHFMLGPDAEAGCVGCSFFADNLPHLSHLTSRETTFAAVSRAPIEKIEAYKTRMGWTFPWYSSFGSDFNYDFHVTSDASVAPVEYNYKEEKELEDNPKLRVFTKGEQPGLSVFIARDGKVFHSYSTYARGAEKLHVTYQMLDLTPLGRQEDDPGHERIVGFKRHNEY